MSLGSSERHALASQWIRVVKHLRKLSRQPHTDNYHNSWVSSVVEGLDRSKQRLRCDFHRPEPVVVSADERLWLKQFVLNLCPCESNH
ncbi:hypothetical protein [Pseudocalidococcus azoricus]|uniref:hypothetical protein n=1 Tax=Pseudocalidococcus azoricus TaxID=3110322 RepID=UPI00389AD151